MDRLKPKKKVNNYLKRFIVLKKLNHKVIKLIDFDTLESELYIAQKDNKQYLVCISTLDIN